jgi:RNA polymerase sigma-70 factor (ECF subfamily)
MPEIPSSHWTTLIAPAGEGRREALTKLCTTYWRPVYTYYRRTHDAQRAFDLTQGFFAQLLDPQRNPLAQADRERGRFRSWLLTSARNFCNNTRASLEARTPHVSIDAMDAEERYCAEPAEALTPERAYERRWALTLLERVMTRLGDEYEGRGQGALFAVLLRCIVGDDARKYRELGASFQMTEDAFAQHVHRFRTRYGKLLAAEVGETVRTTEDLEDELRYLREVLSPEPKRGP